MKFNKKYDLDKFGPCNSVDYDKLKKIIYILENDALLDDATVQSFKKKLCRCCTVGKRANSNFRKLFHNKAMTKSKDQKTRADTTQHASHALKSICCPYFPKGAIRPLLPTESSTNSSTERSAE